MIIDRFVSNFKLSMYRNITLILNIILYVLILCISQVYPLFTSIEIFLQLRNFKLYFKNNVGTYTVEFRPYIST